MNVIEIRDKKQLAPISQAQYHVQFLQSWEWKEFQEKIGRRTIVLGLEREGALVGYALAIFHRLPIGNSLYLPRGPLFAPGTSESDWKLGYVALLSFIKKHAREWKVLFLRIEPPETVSQWMRVEAAFEASELRYKQARFVQPSDTILLNLNQSPHHLLEAMHPKHRYNIKLAKKKGVEAREGGIDLMETFWKLLQKTAARQKIKTHQRDYYSTLLSIFEKPGDAHVRIYLALYQNIPLACHLVLYYRNTAVYLHGGTDAEYRNVMAPYLLHWQTILDAQKQGYHYYDFYGIAPHNAPEGHPLASITRHKRGFGGREVNYVGTFEFVFNHFWYRLYEWRKRWRG